MLDMRWMIRRDIPEVLKMPPMDNIRLSKEELMALLRERHNIGQVVLDGDDKIIGYSIYSIRSANEFGKAMKIIKLAFNDYVTLSFMLQSFKKKLTKGRNSIEIYVQETKLALQNMLKSEEFLAISVVPDYYKKIDSLTGIPLDPVTYEDAYHMRYVM
jgi:ribosomal-protein-alanine N-acetyltransferase